MKEKFLGIDVGTTSLKAAVFDRDGNRLAERTVDYTLDTDPQTGFIELDPERYIDMTRTVIDGLVAECGEITALSVDTQGETLIVTDDGGKPLAPAIVWLDNRATAEASELESAFGTPRVYSVTGQAEVSATWPAAKLLWLRRHRPDLFERAGRIFLLEDWILYNLTGSFVTEPTIQSSSMYYDITKGTWWPEMLEYIGITEKQLPRLVKPATAVGSYRGITVVSGMLDQIAGTVGAGVIAPGLVSEMTGTIMAVSVITDSIPPFDPECPIPCHVHSADGKFALIICSPTAGMALKWFRNQLAEGYTFRELDEMAANIPAGSDGLVMLPYFCGATVPRFNPDARAAFVGLELSHTRAHFARSIMEAVAFNLRQALERIGIDNVDSLRITGGGASSPLWATVKADVIGKELSTLAEPETACLGSALAAAVGVGAYPDLPTAAKAVVRVDKVYAPTGTDYTAAYGRFLEFDKKLN